MPDYVLDRFISSENPWFVLLGTTIGTPVMILLTAGTHPRVVEPLKRDWRTVLVITLGGGFLIGLAAAGYRHRSNLLRDNAPVPWVLRALYDGHPRKGLIFGPILILIICVVAVVV